VFLAGALSSCMDGVQNDKEEGVDCGGTCPNKCTSVGTQGSGAKLPLAIIGGAAGAAVVVAALCAFFIIGAVRKKRQGEGKKRKPKKKNSEVKRVVIRASHVMPAVVEDWEGNQPSRYPNIM
jgi:hypothetical protein